MAGSGLDAATASRSYDRDKGKNFAARVSQDIGAWRIARRELVLDWTQDLPLTA